MSDPTTPGLNDSERV
ncbi:hypothetical protein [Lysinibacillus fusiformis]